MKIVKKKPIVTLAAIIMVVLTFCMAFPSYVYAEEHKCTFDDGHITVEPTCSSVGEIVYYCPICGREMGRSQLEKLEHTPSEKGIVTREATEYQTGQITYYCTVCGEIAYAEIIPLKKMVHEKKPDAQIEAPSVHPAPREDSGPLEFDLNMSRPTDKTPIEGSELDRNDSSKAEGTPSPTPEAEKKERTRIEVSVPITFVKPGFNVKGNNFTGSFKVQVFNSVPVEVESVKLETYHDWNLVAYRGEEVLKDKEVSISINNCLSTNGGFAFSPEYFTVTMPENSVMELPYNVYAKGPSWTKERTSPLGIVMTIRCCE